MNQDHVIALRAPCGQYLKFVHSSLVLRSSRKPDCMESSQNLEQEPMAESLHLLDPLSEDLLSNRGKSKL